jgi:hypothetical protein
MGSDPDHRSHHDRTEEWRAPPHRDLVVLLEGRFVITGTPGPRDWVANVRADPAVQIHVDGETVDAIAIPVDDPGFRRRFFEHRSASWYSSTAELDALIQTAPMVVVTPAR